MPGWEGGEQSGARQRHTLLPPGSRTHNLESQQVMVRVLSPRRAEPTKWRRRGGGGWWRSGGAPVCVENPFALVATHAGGAVEMKSGVVRGRTRPRGRSAASARMVALDVRSAWVGHLDRPRQSISRSRYPCSQDGGGTRTSVGWRSTPPPNHHLRLYETSRPCSSHQSVVGSASNDSSSRKCFHCFITARLTTRLALHPQSIRVKSR